MFNSIITQLLVISQENNTKDIKCYTFLTRLMYNAAMKKGKLKEENVAKISIVAKRVREEMSFEEVSKLVKLMAKKRRRRIN
jgi:hypothetical protein